MADELFFLSQKYFYLSKVHKGRRLARRMSVSQDALIVRLVQWALSHGATIDPSIGLRYTDGMGVHGVASRPLTQSSGTPEALIRIPYQLVIHNSIAADVFGAAFCRTDNRIANGPLKLLLAKLKYDSDHPTFQGTCNLTDFFAPYIDLLPVGKQTNSLFYLSAEEIACYEFTNLGGSIGTKIESLMLEWQQVLDNLPEHFKDDPDFTRQRSLETYSDSESVDKWGWNYKHSSFVNQLLTDASWLSFGAYLWASIMLTSRSFPHRILDPTATEDMAMLLPLVDLLNHKNGTKALWKCEETEESKCNFSLSLGDSYNTGDELFNNYGPKGNEELLMGYGFLIPDNPFDSVALRLPVTKEIIEKASKFNVHLPSIDDYTHHAFDSDSHSSLSESRDPESLVKTGLLYFLNKQNLIPPNLVELFMLFENNKSADDSQHENSKFNLRAKMQALQSLRAALDQKHDFLKQKPVEMARVDPKFKETASVYIKGQQAIVKSSINMIKKMEKELLAQYKPHIWNLKKIWKRDNRYRTIMSELGFNTIDEIEDTGNYKRYLAIWILVQYYLVSEGDDSLASSSLHEMLQHEFTRLSPSAQSLPVGSDVDSLRSVLDGSSSLLMYITRDNIAIAERIVELSSYTRFSDSEMIIVEPHLSV